MVRPRLVELRCTQVFIKRILQVTGSAREPFERNEKRLYFSRAIGGDRHHRCDGWAFTSGRSSGPGGCSTNAMLKQHEAARLGAS